MTPTLQVAGGDLRYRVERPGDNECRRRDFLFDRRPGQTTTAIDVAHAVEDPRVNEYRKLNQMEGLLMTNPSVRRAIRCRAAFCLEFFQSRSTD